MKKIALLALAASTAAVAAPAAAAVTDTGTVQVTGNVSSRCAVVSPGGSTDGAPFSGVIALGALDEVDGTLKTSLEGTSMAATPYTVRVVCNSAQTALTISADTLATGSRGATNSTGYTNEVNYTAEMAVDLAAGGTDSVKYVVGAGSNALANKTVGRLATGGTTNVTVKAYSLIADTGLSTTLLEAGDYSSTIHLTIAPSA